MKRIALISLLSLALIQVSVAQEVSFVINDGLGNDRLKQQIEGNLSHFLTSLNQAYEAKNTPVLSIVDISRDAASSFLMLWKNMDFHCTEPEVVERILTTYSGWQVRNIPLETRQGGYQELVIDIDGSGSITRVNLAIQNHLYRKIMSNAQEVTDLRHRQMILDYVEQFRTAYNRKDIGFLEEVFSEDALIITGKVVHRKKGDRVAILKNSPDIVYTTDSKREYITRLKTRVFPSNSYIRVNFSDITVSKHPTLEGYYGVMLKQGYESSIYSDEGYLFMIWDFRDESRPQIHVRTWQPYWLDDSRTMHLDESKVFNINNFTLE